MRRRAEYAQLNSLLCQAFNKYPGNLDECYLILSFGLSTLGQRVHEVECISESVSPNWICMRIGIHWLTPKKKPGNYLMNRFPKQSAASSRE
jgi:hypothetical protein